MSYIFLLTCLSMMSCMWCSGDERIRTELCVDFCLENATACVSYQTPVFDCYNGQVLFPDDPSWGPYDIKDDTLDNVAFARKFYSSKDGTCENQTDELELPFNECVGPFGQPRPWGKFELIRISSILDTSPKESISEKRFNL